MNNKLLNAILNGNKEVAKVELAAVMSEKRDAAFEAKKMAIAQRFYKK